MSLLYEVPDFQKKRVIIDTDAACEADDPFAIAHALMSKKLIVKGILAEHFVVPDSMEKSYEEICTVLDCMNLQVPVLRGEPGPIATSDGQSEATSFLIQEAMSDDSHPLFILCMGAITNVAAALCRCPEIASRMTVIWIGGQNPDNHSPKFWEFNAGNDVDAVNIVIDSGVEFWQVPNNVYGTMHIGFAELQQKVAPYGRIGAHLVENMFQFNLSENAGWTAGESWSLGDSPTVGIVLEPNCGSSVEREAPVFLPDTSYEFVPGRRKIRVYTSINSRFILEDFMCKLQLLYDKI